MIWENYVKLQHKYISKILHENWDTWKYGEFISNRFQISVSARTGAIYFIINQYKKNLTVFIALSANDDTFQNSKVSSVPLRLSIFTVSFKVQQIFKKC